MTFFKLELQESSGYRLAPFRASIRYYGASVHLEELQSWVAPRIRQRNELIGLTE
jgi:hypothetical protein